jgi:hypothetical protein
MAGWAVDPSRIRAPDLASDVVVHSAHRRAPSAPTAPRRAVSWGYAVRTSRENPSRSHRRLVADPAARGRTPIGSPGGSPGHHRRAPRHRQRHRAGRRVLSRPGLDPRRRGGEPDVPGPLGWCSSHPGSPCRAHSYRSRFTCGPASGRTLPRVVPVAGGVSPPPQQESDIRLTRLIHSPMSVKKNLPGVDFFSFHKTFGARVGSVPPPRSTSFRPRAGILGGPREEGGSPGCVPTPSTGGN